MIAFVRMLLGWSEFDFSAMDSRKRAQADMKNLRWRRYQNRWVDGY